MNTTILSLTRPIRFTPIQIPPSSGHHHRPQLRPLKTGPLRSGNGGSTNNDATSTNSGNTSRSPPITPPPETVEIRFRRGSRRRSRQQQEGTGLPQGAEASAPKDWEAMSLTEKAIELYVGEKGLLFWLNKFAYASIFIVIGGWILFRFVGPALDLYQLDTPPLSPSSILKGS